MPSINSFLFSAHGYPVNVILKTFRNQVQTAVLNLLDVSADNLLTITVPTCGIILYGDKSYEGVRNPVITTFLDKHKGVHTTNIVSGRFLLVKMNKEGGIIGFPHHYYGSEISDLYHEVTQKSLNPKKGKVRLGPKRAKRPFSYFAGDYHKSLKANRLSTLEEMTAHDHELWNKKTDGEKKEYNILLEQQKPVLTFNEKNQKAKEVWDNKTDDEKKPYNDLHTQDIVRYQEELVVFRLRNPQVPKNIRNAYNIYCHENKTKVGRKDWKSLSDEEKKPYRLSSDDDKLRYKTEIENFRLYCENTGGDFEELTGNKRKASKCDVTEFPKLRKKNIQDTKSSQVKKTQKSKKTKSVSEVDKSQHEDTNMDHVDDHASGNESDEFSSDADSD
jgi:hypothetical protein